MFTGVLQHTYSEKLCKSHTKTSVKEFVFKEIANYYSTSISGNFTKTVRIPQNAYFSTSKLTACNIQSRI